MTSVNLRSKPQTRMIEYVNALADPILNPNPNPIVPEVKNRSNALTP